jgi:hypothetical protein
MYVWLSGWALVKFWVTAEPAAELAGDMIGFGQPSIREPLAGL